jgi:hypothetical protein
MFHKGSKTFYIKFYKSTTPTKLGVLPKVSHYTLFQNMKATGNMIADCHVVRTNRRITS